MGGLSVVEIEPVQAVAAPLSDGARTPRSIPVADRCEPAGGWGAVLFRWGQGRLAAKISRHAGWPVRA